MFVANPSDPSFPTIRYVHEIGPASPYAASVRRDRRGQHGQLSVFAGIALAAVAFGAGFVGGMSADPAGVTAPVAQGPMPGEFRLGPGNLTPPGVVVPVD